MKFISLALCGVTLLFCWVGMEHYKAILHEFYQVWDTIDGMKRIGIGNWQIGTDEEQSKVKLPRQINWLKEKWHEITKRGL